MNVMQNKTQQAISLFIQGDLKDAMKMFRSFRLGLTNEEKRSIEIACDCLCGRSSFYISLGIDCDKVINDAMSIVEDKFIKKYYSSVFSKPLVTKS